MKIKTDFITNSSSTSFIITNKTDYHKTIVDFIKENPQLAKEFREEYGASKDEVNVQTLVASAEEDYSDYKLKPNSSDIFVFGDEDCTLLGRVFDNILRKGGESKSFKWEFHEMLR